MTRREAGYHRRSDAQLNADALARRSAPYEAEHRVSLARQNLQTVRAASVRDMTRSILREFALESPAKLADGLHHLDRGGVPEFSAEFMAYLESSPDVTDSGDIDDVSRLPKDDRAKVVIQGYYRWPNRATLYLMEQSTKPRVSRLGGIVAAIVDGMQPDAAAIAYGAHEEDATDTARRALSEFIVRRTALKMRLPKRDD